MSSKELKNKPLVEAILEIRWALLKSAQGTTEAPHSKLLPGRIYDRLCNSYPEHEQLEAANMPDELAGYVAQHRFRAGPADWPLVQIGPGVITLNDTHKYRWDDFKERALAVKDALFDSFPKVSELKVENLSLRYIDGIEIDYLSTSVWDFLREKLKVNVELPAGLFEGNGVESLPQHFQSHQMFKSTNPAGMIQLRFSTGQKNMKPALIWETAFQSIGSDLPDVKEQFEDWLVKAHDLTDSWFFKMIDGELYRRFSGE